MIASTIWTDATKDSVRALVAQGLTARDIAPGVGCSRKMIIEGVKKHGLGPWIAKPGSRPGDTSHIPADFARNWQTMSQAKLTTHYGKSSSTIGTWCKRLGLVRAQSVTMTRPGPKAQKKPSMRPLGRRSQTLGHGLAPSMERYDRDMSAVGQAVSYLQRFGSVKRCTPDGVASLTGTHWLRGAFVLTGEEIIERADWLRDREERRMAA